MSRHCASGAGSARLAVVGAGTSSGSRLREALAACGVPGSRVDLYGATRGEAVLSEYAGEARLIQEPNVAEIARRELVFLCEGGEDAERFLAGASRESILIDLVQSVPRAAAPRLVHLDINPQAAESHEGILAVPHALTVVLAELLLPLERRWGVEEAIAVIARPASDFGDEGVEELRQQIVRLLNFGEVPREVFRHQLAFNLIPQPGPPAESGVERELAELLGWPRPRLALRTVAVPVFYGHAVQLRVRCARTAEAADVRDALREEGLGAVEDEQGPATPMDVATEGKTLVGGIAEDGLDGFWLWAVAGEAEARRAELAVRLAEVLCDL